MHARSHHLGTALLFAACCWTLVRAGRAPTWTVDDAFIVARYARHFSEHFTLAFNLGDPPVEGFTGLLLVFVEAAAHRLGLEPASATRALSYVAFAACAPMYFWIGRELRWSPLASGLAGALFLGLAEHASHILGGLETELHVAASLAAALAFARGLRAERPRFRALGLTCFLASLVRPEGVLVAAVLLVTTTLFWRRHLAQRNEALRTALVFGLLPTLFVQVARAAYFGHLLPNTFFAKRAQGHWTTAVLTDLASLIDTYSLTLAVGAVALVAAERALRSAKTPSRDRRVRTFVGTMALIATMHLVAYSRVEPIMNYGHRFALHVLPWLSLVMAALFDRGVSAARHLGPRAHALALVMVPVLLIRPCQATIDRFSYETDFDSQYETQSRGTYTLAARLVRERLAPDATLACYPDAGIIPYLTELRTIDFGRLNDAYLAREARSPGDVAEYFFRVAPSALTIVGTGRDRYFDAGAYAIVHDSRFADYRLVADYRNADERGLMVFLRADVR